VQGNREVTIALRKTIPFLNNLKQLFQALKAKDLNINRISVETSL
jgi:hypothetical protein